MKTRACNEYGYGEYTADDAFAVTCGALRYAIKRHSYAPSLVWNLIKSHWNDPAVIRQRECIRRDISEYIEEADADRESAIEAREKLNTLRAAIEDMAGSCKSKYGRFPVQNILAAIDSELKKSICSVPDEQDLDLEATWRPALKWIDEHMNDNIENEG